MLLRTVKYLQTDIACPELVSLTNIKLTYSGLAQQELERLGK